MPGQSILPRSYYVRLLSLSDQTAAIELIRRCGSGEIRSKHQLEAEIAKLKNPSPALVQESERPPDGSNDSSTVEVIDKGGGQKSVPKATRRDGATDIYRQQLEKIAAICGKDFAQKIDDQDILSGPSDVKNFAALPPARMRELAPFALKTGTLKDAGKLESEEEEDPQDLEADIRRELTAGILEITKDDNFVEKYGVGGLSEVTDKLYGENGLLKGAGREDLEFLAECDPQQLLETCLGHEGEIKSIADLIKFLTPEIEAVKVDHGDAGAMAQKQSARSVEAIAAIERISQLCGAGYKEALLTHKMRVSDKDVIAWAKESDEHVVGVGNLIGGANTRGVQRAIRYLRQVIDDRTQLGELKNRALQMGGTFELKEHSFHITVRYLNPPAATVAGNDDEDLARQLAELEI